LFYLKLGQLGGFEKARAGPRHRCAFLISIHPSSAAGSHPGALIFTEMNICFSRSRKIRFGETKSRSRQVIERYCTKKRYFFTQIELQDISGGELLDILGFPFRFCLFWSVKH
jgi:hypothetical protein